MRQRAIDSLYAICRLPDVAARLLQERCEKFSCTFVILNLAVDLIQMTFDPRLKRAA